jgi:hypothetical protein
MEEYMEGAVVQGQEDRFINELVGGFALKLSRWHALPVSSEQVSLIVLASTLAHHKDVVEFCLPDKLARASLANLSSVTPSNEEADFLVSNIPNRASAKLKATNLASRDQFRNRAENVQNALSCTLAEPASKARWELPLVKVACVLAFQFSHSPVASLEQIFGSLVRSDLRRCDDLHEREAADPMDTILLAEVLECAAHALAY